MQAPTRSEGLKQLDAELADIDLEDQQAQDAATSLIESLAAAGEVKGFGKGR